MALKFLNDGYFAGKVGIGTESPTAKLHVSTGSSGATVYSGYNDMVIEGGNGASLSFLTPDANPVDINFGTPSSQFAAGIRAGYNSGTEFIAFKVVDSEKMRIIDTGNVGIGTASPSYKLHVKGTVNGNVNIAVENASTGTNAYASYRFKNNSISTAVMFLNGSNNSGYAGASSLNMYQGTNLPLGFVTNNLLRMMVTGAGNVGIGTNNPVEKLQINSGDILINNSTVSTLKSGGSLYIDLNTFGSYSGRNFRISDNGTSLVNVTQVGNVGIGTTSPSAKLHIEGDGSIIRLQNNNSDVNGTFIDFRDSTGTRTGYLGTTGASDDMFLFTQASKPIRFFTNATERARITGAGNVGIGTTSPDYQLEVENTSAQATVGITGGNTDARLHLKNNEGTWIIQNDYSNTGALSFYNSTHRVVITEGGNVGIGTTSPSHKLTIAGTTSHTSAKVSTTTANANFVVTTNNSNFALIGQGSSNRFDIWDSNAGATRLSVNSAGNVGIGTVSPTAGLHVVGTGLFTGLVSGITPVNAANFVTKAYVDGSGGGTGPFLPLAGGTMTAGAVVTFLDSSGSTDDRLKFGTGGDMQLFHDGTASHIVSSGSDLRIDIPNFIVRSASGTESIIRASQNAAVELYYNNSKKFETTDLGVTFSNLAVTSAASSSVDEVKIGTFGAGRPAIFFGTSNTTYSNSTWFIENIGASGKFRIGRNGLDVVEISNTGNTTFAGDITLGANYIGRDGDNYIGFQSDNLIKFRVNGATQVKLSDGIFSPQTDSDVDLGSSGTRFKELWVDSINGGSVVPGSYLPLAGGTMTGVAGVVFPDAFKLNLGTGSDLEIYHNGLSGNNNIDNINGDLYMSQYANDKDIIFRSDNGGGGIAEYLRLDGGIAKTVFSRDAQFLDNAKALFGASYDLQIYHNNTDSYSAVVDVGTGYLLLGTDGPFVLIGNSTATETYIKANNNGSVDLYYDNSKKFETTSTGVTVTDTVTASKGRFTSTGDASVGSTAHAFQTGLTSSTNIIMDNNEIMARNNGAVSALNFNPDGGDVNFHSNTGNTSSITSAGNATFAGNVTATNILTVAGAATGNPYLQFTQGGSQKAYIQYVDSGDSFELQSDNQFVVRTGGSTVALTINSSQNATFAGSVTIPNYIIHDSDPNTFFGFDNNDQVAIKTSGNYNFFGDSTATTLYAAGGAKLKTTHVSVGTATTAGGTLIDGWKTTTQANAINDTTIATTAYVNNKIGLIPAGLQFEGTWDASTGNPPSASPENGQFWIVSVAGSTSLSGITDWKVGDWAIYVVAGSGTDGWQKVDNSSVLDGFGTGQKVTKWDGSGTSNTLTDGPITFSSNDSTFAGDLYIPNKIIHVGDDNTWMQFETDVISLRTGGTDRLTLTNSTATFAGDITSTGLTVDYTGNRTGDAGILVTNDASDWGIKVDKDGTADYGILSQTDGENAIVVRNAAGTTKIQLQGDGDIIIPNGKINTIGGNNLTISGTVADHAGISFATNSILPCVVSATNNNVVDLGQSNNVFKNLYLGSEIISGGGATFAGKIIAGQGVQFTGGTIAAATTVLHTNNVVYARGGSGGMFLQNSDGSDGMFIANDHVRIETGSSERMRIIANGNVGIGTTAPAYKLDVNGGIQAGGLVTYSKVAGSLSTTGYAVAGLTAGFNGASAGFEFKCYGSNSKYQRVVYSCHCSGTTWVPGKVIDEGTNDLDVVASANGATITFTFKARSSTQNFSPRIVIQATGHSINSTYA